MKEIISFILFLTSLMSINVNFENPDVYYSIIGQSKKLSPQEQSALEKSREKVVELARANKGEVFINGPTTRKAVALTFDDGPDSIITPAMLDILKENNVKGAFFFIGNRLEEHADIVKRADREGNLVLSHSFSHPELIKLTPAELKKELSLTEDKIFSLISKRPDVVRPPYGEIDQLTVNRIASYGYKIAMWSLDTMDWSQRDKDNIIRNVVDNVRPGDIISMHSIESNRTSLEALPEIIKNLKNRGFEFLTLDKMLGIKAYR